MNETKAPAKTIRELITGFVMLAMICGVLGWLVRPSEADRQAEEAKVTARAAKAKHEEHLAKIAADRSAMEAEAAKGKKAATIQESLERFRRATTGMPWIVSTATTSYGELVVEVSPQWSRESKEIRLSAADDIGKIWARCDTAWNGDFTLVNSVGSKIGGRGFTGVWVAE
jgi:hypothetical protein